MKEVTGLKGVQLFDDTDNADVAELAKSRLFSRESRGRLVLDRSYKLIGFCRVAAQTDANGKVTIPQWDGVLIETAGANVPIKQFPVSANTLIGLTFTKDNSTGSWQAHQVEKQIFLDIDEIKKNFGRTVTVSALVELPSYDFRTDANGMKKMYQFAR